MSLNIGKLMRELKWKIAMALNVSVVLIAHQKGSPRGEDPALEDIRDSSFISQEADNVVMVWRKPNFTDEELIKIEKENPTAADKIKMRRKGFSLDVTDKFSDGFSVVQIAKSRRAGAFRWNKLFQKNGDFLEEV